MTQSTHELEQEYSRMVEVLAKSGTIIQQELTGDDCHNLHMVIGISGEAGELLDALKKHIIYRKPLDILNVIEELGDIEFYLEGLRRNLGITRAITLVRNMDKLSVRYKDKLSYSDAAAIARADKEA